MRRYNYIINYILTNFKIRDVIRYFNKFDVRSEKFLIYFKELNVNCLSH